MAYNPPPLDRRGTGEHAPAHPFERPTPSWASGSGYVPPSQRPSYGQSPLQALQRQSSAPSTQRSDDMDPEGEDSDVSVRRPDPYRPFNTPTGPATIPPAPPYLETQTAINGRLSELTRAEDVNSARSRDLRVKRQRMDDRIKAKRDAQDRKIKAIMDARQRRDNRIRTRRLREDTEFQRVFDDIEREEEALRRRLKRLKRGVPLDESPQIGNRSISATSGSPPGPTYSTIPPPAKRHQSNPPGQSEGRPSQNGPAPSASASSQAPSYSFYGGSKQSSTPQSGSNYSTVPPSAASGPSNSTPPTTNDRLATAPPSRQVSSSYDTRPPPAATSGFATVNTPPPAGFASVNARPAASSLPPHGVPPRSEDLSRPPVVSNPSDPEKPESNSSTPATGKRTPSTTHPYQMSEAFANRHHHCERVDDLNRGIWTSYGPGGTQEHPTGPPIPMYLRCNHDDCRRIDWRTVHGLQCHIVKSHEQPKGTIGSLEKALDKYGVPVREVEEYERQHGDGSGGTMADPKNMKIKNKTRELEMGRKSTPGSYGVDSGVRPAGYKPSPTASPTSVHAVQPYIHNSPQIRHGPPDSSVPAGRSWNSVNSGSSYMPPRPIDPSKQLQGDAVMRDAPPSTASTPNAPASAVATPAERKPYDFSSRPYESRTNVLTPSSATSKSPSMQAAPAWRVTTGPRASPQSPPPARPFSSSWASRPSWSTGIGAAAKTSAEASPGPATKDEKTLNNAVTDAAPLTTGLIPSHLVVKPSSVASESVGKAASDQTKVTEASSTAAGLQKLESLASNSTATPGSSSQVATSRAEDGGRTKDNNPKPDNPTTMDPPASAAPSGLANTATTNGPASGTRSAQSPSISNKTISAPTSVRRTSRRSSVVATTGSAATSSLPQTDVIASALAGGNWEADAGAEASQKSTAESEGDTSSNVIVVAQPEPRDGKPPTKGEGTSEVSTRTSPSKGSTAEVADSKASAAIKEKEKIEPRTPPPRRAASGRVTRKRTFG
ncbi:uncharacterized protein AB675_4854 [Cyphellophora attinorum]|uniref:Uncharacterized protein n=1 Tax=Cyphellophora attinorum TaxID=1664694 RepID=A0A0N0NHQ5_9EURO|nr:uncharacterized protein AB675_4854 [Phialophora attinorum]KPI34838.1 hypothetical protein AB675_4854 [Phialophora attinorum]